VAAGDGNVLYVGIEAMNDGIGEHWPAEQVDAYVLLCAALCVFVTGNSAQTVRAHRETSVTGKIDPAGIDMDVFRARVAAKIADLTHAPAPTKPKRAGANVEAAILRLQKALENAKPGSVRARVLARSLAALKGLRR
jgi:hypothetical protein